MMASPRLNGGSLSFPPIAPMDSLGMRRLEVFFDPGNRLISIKALAPNAFAERDRPAASASARTHPVVRPARLRVARPLGAMDLPLQSAHRVDSTTPAPCPARRRRRRRRKPG